MKNLLFIATAFVALTAFTFINSTWKSDPPHSQLGFTISHLGIADISGTFNDFTVSVNATKADFSDATFDLTTQVASIDTRIGQRNEHLKSADFFDVEKYPTITFKSTAIKSTGKNKYKLTGDLTLHGVTKPVTLDLLYRGTAENPMNKKQTTGFQLSGIVKRSDFAIGSKFPAPMLSDDVRIKADGEFLKEENK